MKRLSKKIESTLTPREFEIVSLISEGISREEIAEKLAISKLTYDGHRKSIRQKLEIKNQADWVNVLYQIKKNQLK